MFELWAGFISTTRPMKMTKSDNFLSEGARKSPKDNLQSVLWTMRYQESEWPLEEVRQSYWLVANYPSQVIIHPPPQLSIPQRKWFGLEKLPPQRLTGRRKVNRSRILPLLPSGDRGGLMYVGQYRSWITEE